MKQILILISFLAVTSAFAHSGRTDAHGGHRDRQSGGYHYHHGKGPHQHTNGECPYDKPRSNKKDDDFPFSNILLFGAGAAAYYNREKLFK